jgi:hypothetical protein
VITFKSFVDKFLWHMKNQNRILVINAIFLKFLARKSNNNLLKFRYIISTLMFLKLLQRTTTLLQGIMQYIDIIERTPESLL